MRERTLGHAAGLSMVVGGPFANDRNASVENSHLARQPGSAIGSVMAGKVPHGLF